VCIQASTVLRRLKKLGPAVSSNVLDVVQGTICNSTYIARALLCNIDNDSESWEGDLGSSRSALVFENLCENVSHMEVQ